MTEKYEFASPAWVDFAREWAEKALADVDLSDADFSFCEEFTDPPTHLSADGSSIGWHMMIKDGDITVGTGVVDARTKVVADYDTILPLARAIIDPDDAGQAAELAKMMSDAIAAGRFTPPEPDTKGASLPQLAGMHNALAERTL